MKKIILMLLAFNALLLQAQTAGDYRSYATGTWSAAATWQRYDGTAWQPALAAPSSTDGIITVQNSHTVTISTSVTADQLVIDAGGTLAVTATFTLADGTGTDLISNGALVLSSTISGPGSGLIDGIMNWTGGTLASPFTVAAAATMNASGTNTKNLNSVLTNIGTITWSGGSLYLNNGTLTNNGTINNSFDGSINNYGGTNAFTNSGTFSKTSGTGSTYFYLDCTNSGTLNINTGTIYNSSTFTNTGTINVPAAATLNNSSTLNLNTGTVLSGSGTVVMNGTENINIPISLASTLLLNKTSGTTGGTGLMTINGTMNWTGGTLASPFTVAAAATMNASGTNTKNLNNVLTNAGTIAWSAGNLYLNNGTLTNSGTINNSFDGSISNYGGTNVFTNSGIFSKTSGTGSTYFSLNCTNSGTLNINTGTIYNSGTFTNTGTINVPAAATFSNGGTLNLNTGTVLSGSGTVVMNGTENINIPISLASTLLLDKTSGTTGGTELMTINGTMNWTGGTLGSPFNIPATAALNISGSSSKASTQTLTNAGIITWSGGDFTSSNTMTNTGTINWSAGNLYLNNGTLTNSGTINNSFDGSISNYGGTNVFTNSGTFSKTSGTGSTYFSLNCTNSGSLNINTGTIYNSSTFSNTGTINVPAAATFSNGGTLNLNTGTVLSGSGTVVMNGTENINIPISLASTLLLNKTSGTTGGTGLMTINGTMNWTGGTLASPFTVAAAATLNASGTNTKNLNSVLTNAGTIAWSGGTISLNNGTLTNSGTINNSFDGSISNYGGTNAFTNSGTFSKTSGTGSTYFSLNCTNSGTLNINTGTIYNSSTFTNTGTINVPAAATFSNGGTLNLNTGTVLSGSGTVVMNGTENVNIPISLASTLLLDKTSGTTGGTGLMTINGIMNWTGGTLGSPFNIPATAALNISGSSSKAATQTLTNAGIITWSGGDFTCSNTMTNTGTINWSAGNLYLNNGTLTNSGTINNSFDGSISNYGGTNAFTNSGTFSKTSGTGNTYFSLNCTNSGTLNINTGTIYNSGTFTNTGTINIPAAATLNNSSTLNLNTGTVLSGSGTLLMNGTEDINMAISVASTLLLNKSGGTTGGTGLMTINGTMNWTGGTLASPFTVAAAATLNASGTNTKNLNSVLTNAGTIAWSGGSISLNNGTLTNSGTINNSFDGSINNYGGTNAFTNSGTFSKTSGTGNTYFSLNCTNSGTLNVNTGTIYNSGTFTNTGTINVPAAATLNNSSTLNLNTGTVLSGSGTVVMNGTENVNIPISLASTLLLNKTSGTTGGTGLMTINGTMNWTGGTLASPFTIAAAATMNASGTNTRNLNSVLTNAGMIAWSGGSISLNNGTLTNSGTINNSFDGSISNYGGTNAFTNSGIFSKTVTTGITYLSVNTQNTGTFKGRGTLNFGTTFTNNGRIAPGLSPGILTASSSSPVFTANSFLDIELLDGTGPGTGNDQLIVGNATLNGNLNLIELAAVPAGNYTIISSTGTLTGTFSSVTQPGGYSVIYSSNSVVVTKAVLPIKMVSFTALQKDNLVELNWLTATEQNTDYYNIERSADGISFNTIGSVAAAGNSNVAIKYIYTDQRPLPGVNYYRLKTIDKDGKFEYSIIVKAAATGPVIALTVYPNPVLQSFVIDGLQQGQSHIIQLTDAKGQTVKQAKTTDAQVTINMEAQLSGIYWLKVISNKTIITRKIIKQ